ncbi:MAG: hypothetical protein ACRD3Q_12010 [Terriglobales bacterium]
MVSPELATRLTEIANKNLGFVTAAQASADGITQAELDEVVKSDDLTYVDHGTLVNRSRGLSPYPPGIYRYVVSSPNDVRDEWLVVTLLRADPGTALADREPLHSGVVSHEAAAKLHGFPSSSSYIFTFPPGRVDSIEQAQKNLTIAMGKSYVAQVRVYIKPICSEECEYINGIPATNLARTLNDLIIDTTLNAAYIGYLLTLVLKRNLMGEKELSQTIMRAGAEKFMILEEEEVLPMLLEAVRWSNGS